MCGATNLLRAVAIVCMGLVRLAEPAELRCYIDSIDNYIERPITKAIELMDSPCMDLERPTALYAFGYEGLPDGPATTAMIKGYLATKKRNFILVNWQREAASGAFGTALGYALRAVPNAKKVGDQVGQALVTLGRAGLNMTRVHLLGHSLGAHLMCYAGRTARKRGYSVERLTALDAARALFEGSLAINRGVDKTCAKLVVAIHTDPGTYGLKYPAATVDIYVNFAGYDEKTLQPGCPDGEFPLLNKTGRCSHDRSWEYMVESLPGAGNPTAFEAVKAASYEDWKAKRFDSSDTIYLGELTSSKAHGLYYLTTNAASPFGKGAEGIYPVENQRRRRNPTSRGFGSFLRSLR